MAIKTLFSQQQWGNSESKELCLGLMEGNSIYVYLPQGYTPPTKSSGLSEQKVPAIWVKVRSTDSILRKLDT